MTTMDFMNDYYFLEEATRFTKDIKCNKIMKNQSRLNLRFLKLRKEANSRQVRLYFLNNGLTKRKKNQSIFKSQEQTIHWMLEIVFPNATNFTVYRKFNENLKIHEILEKCLKENENKQLDFYRAEGANNLRVLLKAEGLKKCSSRFHEMDIQKSLKSNLSRKTIIEFPTIMVVINHSADDFDVISSDGKIYCLILGSFLSFFSYIPDETVEKEFKEFQKTLHEEVFSKKVGLNPPLILKPEEVPIMAEIVDEANQSNRRESVPSQKTPYRVKVEQAATSKIAESDEEMEPANYLFSKDS